jgi:hypothetical protein
MVPVMGLGEPLSLGSPLGSSEADPLGHGSSLADGLGCALGLPPGALAEPLALPLAPQPGRESEEPVACATTMTPARNTKAVTTRPPKRLVRKENFIGPRLR